MTNGVSDQWPPVTQSDDGAVFGAIEHIYHSYLTGLELMLVTRAGSRHAAEVVFRAFSAASSSPGSFLVSINSN